MRRDTARGPHLNGRAALTLSPNHTLPTARAFVRDRYTLNGCPTLRRYGGEWMRWIENRFVVLEDDELRAELLEWLHQQKTSGGDPFPANSRNLAGAYDALKGVCHLSVRPSLPFWIDDDPKRIDPELLIPCRSFNYRVPGGEQVDASPWLFTRAALGFDPEKDPRRPTSWLKFLTSLWPDDDGQAATLQEFIGYAMTSDTSLQKGLLIVGPKRGGKGTIAHVMERLVGQSNVVGLTTSSLASAFGLQPLIGKSLAIIPDARFHGTDVQIAIERMLSIIGEDSLTIDRKHVATMTVKLPTRIVIMSNAIPKLRDSSGAIVSRFIMLKLTQTFLGREDHALKHKLDDELPSIFAWAIEGLRRLRKRGRFLQPLAGLDLVRDMEDAASPIGVFVRDHCELGAELRTASCDELYQAFKAWCRRNGHSSPPPANTFGGLLREVASGVETRQVTFGRYYAGIHLKGATPDEVHDATELLP